MIQKKKYVRKLIRKKIMGTLTSEEEIDHTIASLLYRGEEFQEMIADVLLSIPDEDLPKNPLPVPEKQKPMFPLDSRRYVVHTLNPRVSLLSGRRSKCRSSFYDRSFMGY